MLPQDIVIIRSSWGEGRWNEDWAVVMVDFVYDLGVGLNN